MKNLENEIRVQILEENNFNIGKLYRLKKDWFLKLQVSTKLIGKNVRVFSNLPPDNIKSQFIRNKYYEYEWKSLPDSLPNDEFNKFIQINCQLAGSYHYYFTLDGTNNKDTCSGGSNFLVDPKLCLNGGEYIDLDCLQVQTVLSKLLGPLNEWKSRLEVANHSGYNMIHFTPVSDLSSQSNSSYCIRNHMKLLQQADSTQQTRLDDLKEITDFMYKEWNMFSICDLVYNHMANDAQFLQECPEATYNMVNSPHLIPSMLLDRLFYYMSADISKGLYESRGIYAKKLEYSNGETIRRILRDELVPKLQLHEFYQIDLNKINEQIKQLNTDDIELKSTNKWEKLQIIQDESYNRLGSTVDFNLIKEIIKESNDHQKLTDHLNHLNNKVREQIESYLTEAVDNVISNLKYYFFANDGPKWTEVNSKQKIVASYFYYPFEDKDVSADFDTMNLEYDEVIAFDKIQGAKIQAHNGWVMTDNPLENFAANGSLVYLRRHLISWDDSVKLRFGKCREDNPKLWDYMAEYTRATARIFHGVRLDNCHSTPIHVAQYFLDIARTVRPDLYVTAELFTNKTQIDNTFVTELGITSLIREGLGAWNANELGRLVHRFGGDPVGSFYQQSQRPLMNGVASAIFFDMTHDNESLIKKHCVYDALPSSSLILMSGCAVGSTRGYDELVPHHIHVVEEKRPYSIWNKQININSGLIKVKSILNKLHQQMAVKGFSQIYVDQFDNDTTTVTRHNPQSHESFILIARTAFSHPHSAYHTLNKPLKIPSKLAQILLEANLSKKKEGVEFKMSEEYVNGLNDHEIVFNENVQVNMSRFIHRIDYNGDESYVYFKYFPPGAVALFKVDLNEKSLSQLGFIRESIFELSNAQSGQMICDIDIEKIIGDLNFDELNILLFRCSNEEKAEHIDSDAYDLNGHGHLIYCGLQGFINVLEKERLSNNLGHAMFNNLREGDWMMNYIVNRLKRYSEQELNERVGLEKLSKWLSKVFEALSNLPRYLLPAYFDLIITNLYIKSLERCFTLMSSTRINNNLLKNFDVINGSSFLRSLSLGSVLFNGHISTALLPNVIAHKNDGLMLALSAGLPHFSDSYMRNWGRDTFISVRGLLLLTNRFKDARHLILSYASTLRHGLIPNLLGEGKLARYNCRDSVWWWLKAIRDYTELAPNGFDILECNVLRLYPTDNSEHPNQNDLNERNGVVQKLSDIIQEALEIHVNGLKFRERNAGLKIDEHMLDDGFNNEIGVDLETGFVYGGNRFNCGTWMDKLGSSVEANNKGIPATPRDGSAVELIGLSRCVLDWLINANEKLKYKNDGVLIKSNQIKFTWIDWAAKIDANFEKYFWLDESSNESKHINKRNIYKDTLNSSVPWTDYQLRPNFLIALTLAPQMINKEHAKKAIEMCTKHLVDEPNSVGIKTLDASDYNYCGYYDNSNHSNDSKVAHGFNYHQGPEWLWPIGYFLRSHLFYMIDNKEEKETALKLVKQHVGKLCERMASNDWKSLPELTNRNGKECYHSCSAQAWSVATTIEVFYDLANFIN